MNWVPGATIGQVVASGHGQGNESHQLSYPEGFDIDKNGSLLISDKENHRIQKWNESDDHGITLTSNIDCANGPGSALNQLHSLSSVIVDRMGTLYEAEDYNPRITHWFKRSKEGGVVVGGRSGGDHINQIRGQCDLAFDRNGNLW
ncbi:unnamed protein product, partial [Rotaria sp. Silwood1]